MEWIKSYKDKLSLLLCFSRINSGTHVNLSLWIPFHCILHNNLMSSLAYVYRLVIVLYPCCQTIRRVERVELQCFRSTDGTVWKGSFPVQPVSSDWNVFNKTVHSWPSAPLTLICPKEDANILSVKFILESHSIRSLFLYCTQCFMSKFDKHEITFSKVKKTSVSQSKIVDHCECLSGWPWTLPWL